MNCKPAIVIDRGDPIQPVAQGISTCSGESCTIWAVFDRTQVEREYPCVDGDVLLAHFLTGWREFWHGPGQAFRELATVQVSRTRVLVKQYCGVDV